MIKFLIKSKKVPLALSSFLNELYYKYDSSFTTLLGHHSLGYLIIELWANARVSTS